MTNKERYEKYAQEITEKVIAQMEKGIIPWDKPFHMVDGRHNSYNSGKCYSLLNQLILDMYLEEDDNRNYIEYATFNAIKKAGGRVNKGAKAKVIYEMFITVKAKTDKDGNVVVDEDGNPEVFPFYTAKKELLFDIEKDTNLQLKGKKERPENKTIPNAENVINNYIKASGVTLVHTEQGRAYYRPSDDLVNVPPLKCFKNSNFYYSVAFHELTHSTGHKSRCNRRNNKAVAFGDEAYSKEELVAEIGAYTLTSTCGITTNKTEKNSTAYLQSWISALKNDTTLFVKAIQQATKAVKYILDCTENKTPDEPEKGSKGKTETTEYKYFLTYNTANNFSYNKNNVFFRALSHNTFIEDYGERRFAWSVNIIDLANDPSLKDMNICVYIAHAFKSRKWDITEATTGLKFAGDFKTKKEALEYLTSDESCKKVQIFLDMFKNPNSAACEAHKRLKEFDALQLDCSPLIHRGVVI